MEWIPKGFPGVVHAPIPVCGKKTDALRSLARSGAVAANSTPAVTSSVVGSDFHVHVLWPRRPFEW